MNRLAAKIQKNKKFASAVGFMFGDMAGAPFENQGRIKAETGFLKEIGSYTDDTLMYVSVLNAYSKNSDLSEMLIKYYDRSRGFGGRMSRMLNNGKCYPANSYGNGAGTRTAALALFDRTSINDVINYAKKTHTHPSALKASAAVFYAVRSALKGSKDLKSSWSVIGEKRDFSKYSFSLHALESIPPALIAFEESESFFETCQKAVVHGGDTDSIGAVSGALAGAYYGFPESFIKYIEAEEKMLKLIWKFCP